MIIDCISDLHGHYPQLDGGDLLIVAGDLTAKDTYQEYIFFKNWMNEQDYKKKIFIAGNHDNLLQKTDIAEEVLYEFDYLCDSGTEFEGLKIWGSPWTSTFKGMNPHCMAFTCETEEGLADKFGSIPNGVDILITHSPPKGILDTTVDGKSVGSRYLFGALQYCLRPKLWVFGHIHEASGKEMYKDTTQCVNASYVNENYKPANKPVRIVI